MPKLTDTQALILTRAARRPGHLAMPLPIGLHGAAAKMVVTKMLQRGWLEEDVVDPHKAEVVWRETNDGRGTTLCATTLGLEAVGVDPVVARTVTRARRKVWGNQPTPPQTPIASRSGTKQAQLINLMQRPNGAAMAEIVAATGWQAHTARAVISATLKKRLGLAVTSCKEEGRGTVYRVAAE